MCSIGIHIITLIRVCYGKFNSFRISRLGMQDITEIYQYINNRREIYFVHCF